MSEPAGAFLRLCVDRDALLRWLDAEVPSPSRWSDWGEIDGRWYLADGPRPLSDTPAALAALAAGVAARLAGATNRGALVDMFRPDDPQGGTAATRHFTYEPVSRGFTAGALLYTEGLDHLIAFLTVARGAVDALGPDGSGAAVVHDYVFAQEHGGRTVAAVRLGPGGASRLLGGDDVADAARTFQPIADRFLSGLERTPEPVDELDALRAEPGPG